MAEPKTGVLEGDNAVAGPRTRGGSAAPEGNAAKSSRGDEETTRVGVDRACPPSGLASRFEAATKAAAPVAASETGALVKALYCP